MREDNNVREHDSDSKCLLIPGTPWRASADYIQSVSLDPDLVNHIKPSSPLTYRNIPVNRSANIFTSSSVINIQPELANKIEAELAITDIMQILCTLLTDMKIKCYYIISYRICQCKNIPVLISGTS